jgi:hypothetical protein
LSTPWTSPSAVASIRSNRVGNDWHRLTQRPAAVADVEHPLHLGEGLALVAEVGASPVDRMPGRRLEIAFAQRHRLSINEQGPRGPLSW